MAYLFAEPFYSNKDKDNYDLGYDTKVSNGAGLQATPGWGLRHYEGDPDNLGVDEEPWLTNSFLTKDGVRLRDGAIIFALKIVSNKDINSRAKSNIDSGSSGQIELSVDTAQESNKDAE